MLQGARLGRGFRIGAAVAVAAGLIAAAALAVPAAAAPVAAGPVHWYLEINPSASTSPPTDIEIESWSWGATNPTTIGSQAGGAGAGKVSFNPFSITRKIDVSSPSFFEDVASGKHFTEIDVVGMQQGAPFMKLALHDALFSSINWSAGNGGGEENPKEELALNFASVQVTVGDATSTANPGTTASWDITTNAGQ